MGLARNTYLGRFVDHDITFGPYSVLSRYVVLNDTLPRIVHSSVLDALNDFVAYALGR